MHDMHVTDGLDDCIDKPDSIYVRHDERTVIPVMHNDRLVKSIRELDIVHDKQ